MEGKNYKELSLVEFQARCKETAMYPDIGKNWDYPAMGLAGEDGEISDLVYHLMQKDSVDIDHIMSQKQTFMSEIGDSMWYEAILCSEFQVDINMLDMVPIKVMSEMSLLIDTKETVPVRLVATALALQSISGKILNQVKKIQRDDNYILTVDRKNKLTYLLQIHHWIITVMLNTFNLTNQEVMHFVIDKLHKRNIEGTIQGDNREYQEKMHA